MLFNRVPDVSHLRMVGSLTWFYNYQIDNKNFQNLRGKVGVLLGYCDKSRSYLIWNPETKRVVRSAEVVFNEQILPFHQFDMNLFACVSFVTSCCKHDRNSDFLLTA